MSDAHDENKKDLAFDLIQYPIAHAQAVKLLFALDLLNSLRVRILRERVNASRYPTPNTRGLKSFSTLGVNSIR